MGSAVSDWLIEGRHVETPCPGCGVPTFPALSGAFELRCIDCGRAKHGAAVPVRPVPGANNGLRMGQGGVGFSHEVRPGVELERAPAPVRTVLFPAGPVRPDNVLHPSTAVRLAKRAGGGMEYAAAWFCEGDVRAAGLDAFVLREVLAVWWSGEARGFALWSRSGRGGWKPGAAFWTDPTSGLVHYGRCSAVPATLFT